MIVLGKRVGGNVSQTQKIEFYCQVSQHFCHSLYVGFLKIYNYVYRLLYLVNSWNFVINVKRWIFTTPRGSEVKVNRSPPPLQGIVVLVYTKTVR